VSVLKSPQDADRKAEHEIVAGMYRRGYEAEARGDYALAEREYQNAVARDGGPFFRTPLARLYDLMGRDRDAYAQYRAILRARPDLDVPRVFARYGELCLGFGDRNEARAAYTLAVERCVYGGSVLEPKIAPRNVSFDAVRAAALLCWAMKSGTTEGTETQMVHLDEAERIDPSNWMIRFYRAWTLSRLQRRDEAQTEADKALSLAPSSSRAQIIEMMDVRGFRLP